MEEKDLEEILKLLSDSDRIILHTLQLVREAFEGLEKRVEELEKR